MRNVTSHIESYLTGFIELKHDNALLCNFHLNKNSVSFATSLNIFPAIHSLWNHVLRTSMKQGRSTATHKVYEEITPNLNECALFYTTLMKGRFGIGLKVDLNVL